MSGTEIIHFTKALGGFVCVANCNASTHLNVHTHSVPAWFHHRWRGINTSEALSNELSYMSIVI